MCVRRLGRLIITTAGSKHGSLSPFVVLRVSYFSLTQYKLNYGLYMSNYEKYALMYLLTCKL